MNIFIKLLFLQIMVVLASCTDDGSKALTSPVGKYVPRSASLMSGSSFVAALKSKSKQGREDMILREVTKGNYPNFLRRLKKVNLTTRLPNNKVLRGAIFVMPDYLSVGKSSNFVRVPMNPITANKIAQRMGFILPTTKMVDDIYRAAAVKLSPRPLPPGRQMTGVSYFDRHNRIVDRQLKGQSHWQLVAGHKKDIVMTNKLLRRPKQVAIYGWHRRSGKPIQPLSLVHDNKYADYSHGVRLISKFMMVGRKKYYVKDVLKHPSWSRLISYEGTMKKAQASLVSVGPSELEVPEQDNQLFSFLRFK